MFKSFFPRPTLFFWSAILWTAIAVANWYALGSVEGAMLGFATPDGDPPLGLGYFVTSDFLWFYLYCGAAFGAFSTVWFVLSPHPYQWWSVVGTGLIVFSDYLSVQVSVAINNWRGPFFDDVQAALSGGATKTAGNFYALIAIFLQIALVWVGIYVVSRFFVSHL